MKKIIISFCLIISAMISQSMEASLQRAFFRKSPFAFQRPFARSFHSRPSFSPQPLKNGFGGNVIIAGGIFYAGYLYGIHQAGTSYSDKHKAFWKNSAKVCSAIGDGDTLKASIYAQDIAFDLFPSLKKRIDEEKKKNS